MTDEYDRTPLLASRQGRLQKTTLRMYVYQWTRPCAHGEEALDWCEKRAASSETVLEEFADLIENVNTAE